MLKLFYLYRSANIFLIRGHFFFLSEYEATFFLGCCMGKIIEGNHNISGRQFRIVPADTAETYHSSMLNYTETLLIRSGGAT